MECDLLVIDETSMVDVKLMQALMWAVPDDAALRGAIPDLSKPEGDSDFYFVPADDPETAVPRIIELVKTRIPHRFMTLSPGANVQPKRQAVSGGR